MSYRPHDSSKTRVTPVFDALGAGTTWLPRLLRLASHGHGQAAVAEDDDLSVIEGFWGDHEKALDPPVSLLSWLIRHPPQSCADLPEDGTDTARKRRLLSQGDPSTVAEALALLRREPSPKRWNVLEGPTCPDAFLVTNDALVVVEGKRTETGPTTSTKWMPVRHQMLRHLDAAWEIRGRRRVYGLFIVDTKDGTATPAKWINAAEATVAVNSLSESMPHRSHEERMEIARCFLGVTTWQAVCAEFGLDRRVLIERIERA